MSKMPSNPDTLIEMDYSGTLTFDMLKVRMTWAEKRTLVSRSEKLKLGTAEICQEISAGCIDVDFRTAFKYSVDGEMQVSAEQAIETLL